MASFQIAARKGIGSADYGMKGRVSSKLVSK